MFMSKSVLKNVFSDISIEAILKCYQRVKHAGSTSNMKGFQWPSTPAESRLLIRKTA